MPSQGRWSWEGRSAVVKADHASSTLPQPGVPQSVGTDLPAQCCSEYNELVAQPQPEDTALAAELQTVVGTEHPAEESLGIDLHEGSSDV